MAPSMLFFTGAPEARSLNWDANAHLLDGFDQPILRYAGLDNSTSVRNAGEEFSVKDPYWRSLPLERRHLATGVSQNIWKEEYRGAQFFTTSCVDTIIDDIATTQGEQTPSLHSVEEILSQFYEQSYGVHQDVSSSQLEAVSQATSTHLSDSSFSYSTSDSFDTHLSSKGRIQDPPSCQLHNLKDIPNSKYLIAINPQTLTVNIVVGVISVLDARNIRTRRGADVTLIELIVGDDTKSGFSINFWMSSDTEKEENLVSSLRPQDVVLIHNVALSSFRSRVHGQSLRKNVTQVHLLYRKRLDSKDYGGYYRTSDLESSEKHTMQIEKTKLVKTWVQQFVSARKKDKQDTNKVKELMPPDTPSSQS